MCLAGCKAALTVVSEKSQGGDVMLTQARRAGVPWRICHHPCRPEEVGAVAIR